MSFSIISVIVLIAHCICFITAYELKYADGYYRREFDGGYGGYAGYAGYGGYGRYPMRPMGMGRYPPIGPYPPMGVPVYGYGHIDFPDTPYATK